MTILRILGTAGAKTREDRVNINVALDELLLSYSREDEILADKLSVKYLERAQYNPEAALSVLEKLKEIEMEGPIRPKRRWRTHPYLSDRAAAIRAEVYGNIEFMDYANTLPNNGAGYVR